MFLLYLDASGDVGWCPPHGGSRTQYYVLGGLALREERWPDAFKGVNEIVEGHLRPKKGFKKLLWSPRSVELKYSALVHGSGPYDGLKDVEKKALADDVFNLIKSLRPTLFAIVVNKVKHKKKYGDRAFRPDHIGVRFIAPRFQKFLVRRRSYGMMLMDREQAPRERRLKKIIQDARAYGIVLQSPLDPYRTDTNLSRVVEDIAFLDSKESRLIQLADFVAHTVWVKHQWRRKDRFNQISPLFDSYQGRAYGIREWP